MRPQTRLAKAEAELVELPDFSRLPREPGSLMTQLASSFHVARDARDGEQAKLEQMTVRLSEQRDAITESEALFADSPDFEAVARDYEVKIRLRDKAIADLEDGLDGLEARVQEHGARGSRVRGDVGFCGGVFGGVVGGCAGAQHQRNLYCGGVHGAGVRLLSGEDAVRAKEHGEGANGVGAGGDEDR